MSELGGPIHPDPADQGAEPEAKLGAGRNGNGEPSPCGDCLKRQEELLAHQRELRRDILLGACAMFLLGAILAAYKLQVRTPS